MTVAQVATPTRVVYLLGAGATQGCVSFLGSNASLVMPGLIEQLTHGMKQKYYERYSDHPGIGRLVNEVVNEDTDFEQLLTFLEEATSVDYRSFAADLKVIFSAVLRSRLDQAQQELGARHSELYAALIDMHEVDGNNESLRGFLTLNYDVYLEHAITHWLGRGVDFGIEVTRPQAQEGPPIRVLKLHGSFGWSESWPIALLPGTAHGLWIPPGIRKSKTEYPFNAIWGHARELLDCDVVRVIGCNLGPNDWDLVSLLFTTMHTHASAGPYAVEIIASPRTARKIAGLFPYLEVRNLLELPDVGPQIVAEVLGGPPRQADSLTDDELTQAAANLGGAVGNPFAYWLRMKGEVMSRDMDSLGTAAGLFERFIEMG